MNNEEGLLRILNYGEHPTNSLYLVFHFVDELHAVRFKDLITARGLWFEYDEDDSGEIKRYLFAIKKMDRKAALNCNYLVKGEFRSIYSQYLVSLDVVANNICCIDFSLYWFY
jgi:hypothetical protein